MHISLSIYLKFCLNQFKLFILKKKLCTCEHFMVLQYLILYTIVQQSMRINIVLIAELLQYHILSYLSLSELCLLRRVSKYFNEEVIIYFSNLKTLDITGYKNILTEEGFGYMVIHLKQLLEVYLTSCWKCASAINVRVIINRCPNLKVFVADHCGYIDDNILEELGRRCKSINHLDISYCFNAS